MKQEFYDHFNEELNEHNLPIRKEKIESFLEKIQPNKVSPSAVKSRLLQVRRGCYTKEAKKFNYTIDQ